MLVCLFVFLGVLVGEKVENMNAKINGSLDARKRVFVYSAVSIIFFPDNTIWHIKELCKNGL